MIRWLTLLLVLAVIAAITIAALTHQSDNGVGRALQQSMQREARSGEGYGP